MTDPKFRDPLFLDDEPRPSHDMLETAREIRFSAEEQEEEVAREEQRRREQATRVLHEQAVAAYAVAVVAQRRARSWLTTHVIAWGVGNAALAAIDLTTAGGGWFRWPLLGWSVLLAGHAAWVLTRPKATPPAPLPSAERAASLRPSVPRPLAGRGREGADEELQARARTTQRSPRKTD